VGFYIITSIYPSTFCTDGFIQKRDDFEFPAKMIFAIISKTINRVHAITIYTSFDLSNFSEQKE